MLRKIGFSLLCAAAASLSPNVYAMENYASLDYVFAPAPADPVVLSNYMYWTVEANCKITIEDENKNLGNELVAEALAGQGKIDNEPLTKGNTKSVTVKHGDYLRISANSGAKVRITNKGTQIVKATCSTV